MTGTTRVLGLMFSLLCLLSLDNCMESNFTFGGEVTVIKLQEARRIVQNAEAAKEKNKFIRKTSEEMFAEWERHADTMEDIIARGPSEMRKLQPIFQHMDNLVVEVRQELFKMIYENEEMALKLDEAKKLLAYLERPREEEM